MIRVEVNADPRDIENEWWFGLTPRQFICSAIIILINVPLYIFGRKYIQRDILGFLIMLIAAPIGAIGFYKYNGLYCEEVIKLRIKSFLESPKKRYIKKNIVNEIDQEYINEEFTRIKNLNKKKYHRKLKKRKK